MKLLIAGVVAFLCMQTIDALIFRTQCQRDLAADRTNVRKWFKKFEGEHNIAHGDLNTILTICTGLTAAIKSFLDPAAQPTECQIAQFFETFFAARLAALEAITHLRYYCDVLLNMADEYRCRRNDVCIRDFAGASVCETDANGDRCELVDFFGNLATFGAQAKDYLDGLLKSCDQLGLLARNFDCTNKPSCNTRGCGCGAQGGQSNPNILAEFHDFIVNFNVVHGVAHDQLVGVKDICDLLTAVIAGFENKY